MKKQLTPAETLAAKIEANGEQARTNNRVLRWRCKLAERRQSLGLSLRSVGTAINMNQQTLLDIERGCDPKLTQVTALAKFFGCTIDELWQPLKSPEGEGIGA